MTVAQKEAGKKSELEGILDGLESLYGEGVAVSTLSAHQAGADRLGDRLWNAISHGRLRLSDAASTIEVDLLDFVWVPRARFGATCYGKGCRQRRISPGDGMYFARAKGNRESVNLCASCGAPYFERQQQTLAV